MLFDASCKGKSNLSLNDVLNLEQSLSRSLSDILSRFCSFTVVDLEKSSLQISLVPDNRNYVRFIWFEDIINLDFDNFDIHNIVEFRIFRILCWLTSSSFLLTGMLRNYLNQYVYSDSDLLRKFYH